ncbi:MAG: hypothetical protein IJW86_01580 [Clostridia bacterium]|nr:hypothetical protein [Clostridia bacterium]
MKKEDLSAAMSNIDVTFIEEAENYDMTKRKIIKRPLSRLAVAAILLGCLIFSGVAYAGATLTDWESVISFFDEDGNETKVTVSDEAFFKELPDGLPVPGDGEPMIAMTKNEVEELLGFEILGSELSPKSTVFNYDAEVNFNSDTVATVSLWCPGFISESETNHISYKVNILSTDAEEGYILPFIEGKDAMGGKVYMETYTLGNLGTDAVIYTYDLDNRTNATFVYDNIYYTVSAYEYTLDEFKAILNTLR